MSFLELRGARLFFTDEGSGQPPISHSHIPVRLLQ